METFCIYCHRRLPQVLSHSEMSFRAPQGPFTAWVREYPSDLLLREPGRPFTRSARRVPATHDQLSAASVGRAAQPPSAPLPQRSEMIQAGRQAGRTAAERADTEATDEGVR